MQIPKPTDADKEFFRSVLPDDPEIEIKPMFGNLGAFVHGNMFAGLFGPDVGVRLDDGGRAELEAADGSGPFGPERAADGRLPQPAPGLARRALRSPRAGSSGPAITWPRCRPSRRSPGLRRSGPGPRPGRRRPSRRPRRAVIGRRPAYAAG